MKAVVAAFNQEKALVGAFSVITNLWMEIFEALISNVNMWLNVLTVAVCREQQEGGAGGGEGEEEDGQQNNLLDCLVQAQNFALQQATGNKNFDNNINNFSPQHIMQGEQENGENIKLVVEKMPLSLSASIRPHFLFPHLPTI